MSTLKPVLIPRIIPVHQRCLCHLITRYRWLTVKLRPTGRFPGYAICWTDVLNEVVDLLLGHPAELNLNLFRLLVSVGRDHTRLAETRK